MGLRGLKASHLAVRHLLGQLAALSEEFFGALADVLLLGGEFAGLLPVRLAWLLSGGLLSACLLA